MNKTIIKSSVGILGIALGIALLLGTWRNFVWWTLGSGLFGASFLAILVGAVGTTVALLVILNSVQFLTKKKEVTNNENPN